MSVDYTVSVIYGYKLDTQKIAELDKQITDQNPYYNIFNWLEEQCEGTNCEVIIDNHYASIDCCDIYFGIRYENRLVPHLLSEMEHCRRAEVEDELARIFGDSFSILEEGKYIPPEFFAIGIIY